MKPRLAVAYARVSSKGQERDGFSIPAQLQLFNTYAAEKDFVIERQYTDVETAKEAGRSGFKEMVSFLRANRSHVLLVEKADRLYRNLKDWVTMDDWVWRLTSSKKA
jgi:site-specific DNA recombinase